MRILRWTKTRRHFVVHLSAFRVLLMRQLTPGYRVTNGRIPELLRARDLTRSLDRPDLALASGSLERAAIFDDIMS